MYASVTTFRALSNITNMAAVAQLSELSAIIVKNTKIVTDYLTSKGLSAPSFDVHRLEGFPILSSDKEAFTVQLKCYFCVASSLSI